MAKYTYGKNDNTYLTPPSLIQKGLQILALDKGVTGVEKFDIDVCCSNTNVPAEIHYTYPEHDGLQEHWGKYNWCNPPFDECKKWVGKAYLEQQKGKTSILLIPARTETAYWHEFILNRPNVTPIFLRKGYRFINPETHEEMGVFKNALALVVFRGIKC